MRLKDDTAELIGLLNSEDRLERSMAERLIITQGSKAIPALLAYIDNDDYRNPAARQSMIYILGKLGKKYRNPGIALVLGRTLRSDPEPEIRMNAAVALGKTGYDDNLEYLKEALANEEVPWVRSSVILALGAISSEGAYQILKSIETDNEAETEALRKALDRCKHRDNDVRWKIAGKPKAPLYLDVPPGLEDLCIAEGEEFSIAGLRYVMPGRLACSSKVAPWDVFPKMRSVYGVRLLLAATTVSGTGKAVELNQAISRVLTEAFSSFSPMDWFDTNAPGLRYRFSLEKSAMGRNGLRSLLQQVRRICSPHGLQDSPSNYDIELVAAAEDGEVRLYLKPSFMTDDRFAYRRSDVGASINPCIGSILARLLKADNAGIVFDPTCGSGTLLIEVALSGFKGRLIGLDISQTAVRAARININASGLAERICIIEGDASSEANWPMCDRVIANLPFGLRVRNKDVEIDALYELIAARLASHLRQGGRAVLYSASKRALDQSIAKQKRLKKTGSYKVVSGGLTVFIRILERV